MYQIKRRFSKDKGIVFERHVDKELKRKFWSKYVISDLLLVNGNKTSQIDTIIIGKRAIYSIEVKARFGTIKRTSDERLIQILNPSLSHEMPDPLIQNKVHEQFIKKIVGNNINIFGMIVFPDDTILELDRPFCNLKDLAKYIKSVEKDFKKQKFPKLNRKELLKIIKKQNQNSRKNRETHLDFIKRKND